MFSVMCVLQWCVCCSDITAAPDRPWFHVKLSPVTNPDELKLFLKCTWFYRQTPRQTQTRPASEKCQNMNIRIHKTSCFYMINLHNHQTHFKKLESNIMLFLKRLTCSRWDPRSLAMRSRGLSRADWPQAPPRPTHTRAHTNKHRSVKPSLQTQFY